MKKRKEKQMLRKLFKKEDIEVLGVEKFMSILPLPDGMETVGILISDEDGKDVKRGDVIIGNKESK